MLENALQLARNVVNLLQRNWGPSLILYLMILISLLQMDRRFSALNARPMDMWPEIAKRSSAITARGQGILSLSVPSDLHGKMNKLNQDSIKDELLSRLNYIQLHLKAHLLMLWRWQPSRFRTCLLHLSLLPSLPWVSLVSTFLNSPTTFFAFHSSIPFPASIIPAWVLNSGAFNHMTVVKQNLTNT